MLHFEELDSTVYLRLLRPCLLLPSPGILWVRNFHCIFPLKPGGHAPEPALQDSPSNGQLSAPVGWASPILSSPPFPIPALATTCHLRMGTSLEKREQEREWERKRLSHGSTVQIGRGAGGVRKWSRQGGHWVMDFLAQYRSVHPSSAFLALTDNSCPAWHHFFCQVLLHLTLHLILTTCYATFILVSIVQ